MSDAAIANIVTGLVTVVISVVGFLTLWVRLKYNREETDKKVELVEQKIDHNTAITRAGTAAAASSASVAANTAHEAKVAAQFMQTSLEKKLNGGVDAAVEAAVKPLRDAMLEHALQDEANMKEIRELLADINKKGRY